jgi:hypothetical protein
MALTPEQAEALLAYIEEVADRILYGYVERLYLEGKNSPSGHVSDELYRLMHDVKDIRHSARALQRGYI